MGALKPAGNFIPYIPNFLCSSRQFWLRPNNEQANPANHVLGVAWREKSFLGDLGRRGEREICASGAPNDFSRSCEPPNAPTHFPDVPKKSLNREWKAWGEYGKITGLMGLKAFTEVDYRVCWRFRRLRMLSERAECGIGKG